MNIITALKEIHSPNLDRLMIFLYVKMSRSFANNCKLLLWNSETSIENSTCKLNQRLTLFSQEENATMVTQLVNLLETFKMLNVHCLSVKTDCLINLV